MSVSLVELEFFLREEGYRKKTELYETIRRMREAKGIM